MVKSSSNSTGAGCIGVFGTIFFLAGVGAILGSAHATPKHGQSAGQPVIVGAIFALVGAAIVGGAFWLRKSTLRERDTEALYPGQPWKWKKQWANGEIHDESKSSMIGMWVFAAIWNGVTTPFVIFGWQELIIKHSGAGWLMLLFVLVGLSLIGGALLQTVRRRKFGESVFTVSPMPLSPGGAASGIIRIPSGLSAGDSVSLHLYCVHRHETGSGKNSHTTDTLLWEEDRDAKVTIARGSSAAEIPVHYLLPATVPTTDNANARDQRIWRLEAKASLPGADYFARFDLPVFANPAADGAATVSPASTPNSIDYIDVEQSPIDPTEPPMLKPTEAGVTATRRIDGGWDFHIAAGRNNSFAVVMFLFFLIFGGATVMLIFLSGSYGSTKGAFELIFFIVPKLMAVPFALVTLLLALGVLQTLFGESDITVSRGTITVSSGSFFYRRTKHAQAAEVQGVTMKISSTMGNRAYYRLKVITADGHGFAVADGISSKRDAEWMVGKIKESLAIK